MKIESFFTTADEATARFAIMCYSDGLNASAAVLHPLINDGGQLSMGAGTVLDDETIRDVFGRMQGHVAVQVLPDNVLVSTPLVTAWWTPVQHRSVFFATSSKEFNEECSGKLALWPPLLFIATRTALRVFALPSSERPGPDTLLMRAPCMNVYEMGNVCRGDAPMPSTPSVDTIADYERFFFESSFTHTNAGAASLTSCWLGHNGFWRMMVATPHKMYPYQWLLPAIRGKDQLTFQEALSL